jgi:hypothetical protein
MAKPALCSSFLSFILTINSKKRTGKILRLPDESLALKEYRRTLTTKRYTNYTYGLSKTLYMQVLEALCAHIIV